MAREEEKDGGIEEEEDRGREEEEQAEEELEQLEEAPRAFSSLCTRSSFGSGPSPPIPQVPGEGELAPSIPGVPGFGIFLGGCLELAELQSRAADGPQGDIGGSLVI